MPSTETVEIDQQWTDADFSVLTSFTLPSFVTFLDEPIIIIITMTQQPYMGPGLL
jgi:hypothetical protein